MERTILDVTEVYKQGKGGWCGAHVIKALLFRDEGNIYLALGMCKEKDRFVE